MRESHNFYRRLEVITRQITQIFGNAGILMIEKPHRRAHFRKNNSF
jgi:hypothetical protein